MIITYHHGVLQQKQDSVHTMETDVSSLDGSHLGLRYTGYCAITVTPESKSTTITKIDTGDGTSWANVYPSSGTGNYSFRARMMEDNPNPYERSMDLRISDDSHVLLPITISLKQLANIE